MCKVLLHLTFDSRDKRIPNHLPGICFSHRGVSTPTDYKTRTCQERIYEVFGLPQSEWIMESRRVGKAILKAPDNLTISKCYEENSPESWPKGYIFQSITLGANPFTFGTIDPASRK